MHCLRDKYKGKRAFVVGTGPSLRKLDVSKLKGEVVFASNGIYRHPGIHPSVYSVEDRRMAADLADNMNAYGVPDLKVFPTDLSHLLRGDAYYEFIRSWDYSFSKDAEVGMQWGATVTYVLLQLAYYAGCRPVYMIGMDCTQEHFVPNEEYFGKHVPNKAHWEHVFRCYLLADWYFRDAGSAVYNATVGGALECLERVDFDSLF